MKHISRLSLLALGLFLSLTSFAAKKQTLQQQADEAWKTTYPEILSRIKAPEFRNVDYRITDFGAKVNDTTYLNTSAIAAAINKCSHEGGGRVVIPAGTWFTGPITLKNNVNLHLEDGAILLFTRDLKEYPIVLTRWEGMDCYNYQPQVYAYNVENVAITGKGTLDGAGTRQDWWAMCGAPHYGWKEGMVSQRIGRPLLQKWNEAEKPIYERKMGDGYGMRTQLLNLYKCKNILIEDVTMLRSPFWVIHPLLCQNMTVRGVKVINDGPNGDGCDPESCKDVLIENCHFNTGDDCIAIKSGRNEDGRRWNVPSENIIVRGCYMENGHGGVVVGSEITGGYKNLFVENCKMNSPMLDRVIRIKTNTCRGGQIENIYVRNVEVGECKEAVLKINLNYDPKEPAKRGFMPLVRNVFLENVNCQKSQYGVRIVALQEQCNIENIGIADCNWTGVKDNCNYITGKTANIEFKNLKINGKKPVTKQD